MQTLFPEIADLPPGTQTGLFAGVAMEQSIDRVLDYSVPKRLAQSIHVGQRVRVPLGRNNKPSHGLIVYLRDTADYPKIKDLHSIDDERVLLGEKLIELARWMSR
jgi:primosomal protein N' (replication factor Y)